MKESNTILILVALLIISLMINFYLYFLRPPMIKETKTEIIKRDTIVNTIRDFDTVYVTNTKYKDIYHYDTIHKENKVYIQDTVHNYAFKEKDYNLDINAVRLDNYKLDIHTRDTIKYTETVYQTIYKQRSNKPQIGLYGGLGYDIKGKTFGPEIGIGVVLPLTKW